MKHSWLVARLKMSDFIDKSKAVRKGEELDYSRLAAYLRERLPGMEGPLEIEQFPAGFSNLTYLIRSGSNEVVLRRPPFGAKIKTAHDMGREFLMLSHLYPMYDRVPKPLLFCDDQSVLGVKFYVMERVKGIILRAQRPSGMELSKADMKKISRAFVSNLVEIHGLDYRAAGLGDLGQPIGYVGRQIEGWTRRYHDARTDDVSAIERLATWLLSNLPPDSSTSALIHNDYKYDNVVLAPDDLATIKAVLDWEMATVGDPLMDLGTTIAYWTDSDDCEEWQRYGFGLTASPGSLTRREVVESYSAQSGRDTSNIVFYYAYGLLKIAGIVQQIYFRYRRGMTSDPRFANLGMLVKTCGDVALRAIEKDRIDQLG